MSLSLVNSVLSSVGVLPVRLTDVFQHLQETNPFAASAIMVLPTMILPSTAYNSPLIYNNPALSFLVATASALGLEIGLRLAELTDPFRDTIHREEYTDPGSVWFAAAKACQRDFLSEYDLHAFFKSRELINQALDTFSSQAEWRETIFSGMSLPKTASFEDVLQHTMNNIHAAMHDPNHTNDIVVNKEGRELLWNALYHISRTKAAAAMSWRGRLAAEAESPGLFLLPTHLQADRHEATTFTQSVLAQMYLQAISSAGALVTTSQDVDFAFRFMKRDATLSELVSAAIQITTTTGVEISDELHAGLCWMSENQMWTDLTQDDDQHNIELSHATARMPRKALVRIHAKNPSWKKDNFDVFRCYRLFTVLRSHPGAEFSKTPISQFFGGLELFANLNPNMSMMANFEDQTQYVTELVDSVVSNIDLDAASGLFITGETQETWDEWYHRQQFKAKGLANLPKDVLDKVKRLVTEAMAEVYTQFWSSKIQLVLSSVFTSVSIAFVRDPLEGTFKLLVCSSFLVKVAFFLCRGSSKLYGMFKRRIVPYLPLPNRPRVAAALDRWWSNPASTSEYPPELRDSLLQMTTHHMRMLWTWVCTRPMSSDHRVLVGSMMQHANHASQVKIDSNVPVPLRVKQLTQFMNAVHKNAFEEDSTVYDYLNRWLYAKYSPLRLFASKQTTDSSAVLVLLSVLLAGDGVAL